MDSSYEHWNEPKKHSVAELDNLWLETTKELYGADGEVFTYKNAEHLWSYVPHFHNPFYVYCYSCAEFLTQSVMAQKDRLGKQFEPLYLDLLRAGSTKGIVELMAPFGFDPTSESFWADAINASLGKMIEEAEKLSVEIDI
jgi:oligoendopeptidase F